MYAPKIITIIKIYENYLLPIVMSSNLYKCTLLDYQLQHQLELIIG